MIDTDKYEGHPPAPWGWRHKVAVYWLTANGDKEWIDIQVNEDADPTVMALIADAPLLLAEVKRLRDRLNQVKQVEVALWNVLDNWNICMDDYSMHDQYENLDERYAWADWGIILKELYTYTEEDGWQPKEMIE